MHLTPVRTALREVVPGLVALVRNLGEADPVSVGTWTTSEVAAHLSHVFRFDIDAIAGNPVPDATVTAAGMAEVNAKLLADDGERDPAALADRLSALATEFDDVASRAGTAEFDDVASRAGTAEFDDVASPSRADTVEWLQGLRLPSSVVAAHLLEECLIHGHDLASATGRPWPIRRDHALLAVEGGVLPLITALPPTAFVDQEKAGSFRARFDVRLRGGGRTTMVFDRGSLTLDENYSGAVDACLSADPAALMLVFIGRQSIGKPLLAGKLAAWGPRPWKLARLLTAISPP
ncbi:hypothetical protein [Amycolatopsis sp. 195334CR]|uniref:hypothetical protein n=1 Tax=Amycolatopsis sp. 195334CR TaxID=2814588 RepID=UPI001A8E6BCF|nr:hypothetical protein [Amycolatopsis sp. 195334CR]MBN6040293.1 hypothetical protein [Amycolatopsis sp. 195334CR]